MELPVNRLQSEPETQPSFRAPRWLKAAVLSGMVLFNSVPAFAETPAPTKPNKPNKQGDYATSVKQGSCAPFQYPVWAETAEINGKCLDFLAGSTEVEELIGLSASSNISEVQPETRYKVVKSADGIEVNFSAQGPTSRYGFGIEVKKGQIASIQTMGNQFASYEVDYTDEEPEVRLVWTTVLPLLP